MTSKDSIRKVLIAVPTYNEASTIAELITKLLDCVNQKQLTLEVLVLDDHSPDGTAKQVKRLQKNHRNVHLLSGQKAGLGPAYIRGFRQALKRLDFDVLVMMDADLSHDPSYIPLLLKAIDGGADYAIGSRYMPHSKIDADWPRHRKLLSRMANLIAHKLVGIDAGITDTTGGFKAMRRDALAQIDLSRLNARGYIFQVSLLHAFMAKGFRVKEVPITFSERKNGKSKLDLRNMLEFVYRAYKLNPNAPIQRLVRFGLVGACGTAVNLIALTVFFKLLHFDVLVSSALAIEISINNNFFLNHYYTFKGYGAYDLRQPSESLSSLLTKLVKFNLGALGGAAITFVTFGLLFKQLHLNYILADLLAILLALSWNYWVSTRYVWKRID